MTSEGGDPVRTKALADYKKKLLEHKEIDAKLKTMRDDLKTLTKQYDKSENDLKALQSVGQIVGEVLRQLTEDKFIVKATNGPRYWLYYAKGPFRLRDSTMRYQTHDNLITF